MIDQITKPTPGLDASGVSRSHGPPLVIGLHVPKCAGMTILRHAQRHMSDQHFYQCTALYENFVKDRREFLHLRNRDELRFVFGHHFHEEMLKYLREPQILFTGLRHPVDRMTSQLNYNERLFRHLGKKFDAQAVVSRIENPACKFLIRRFPSIAGMSGALSDRAMRVLECFTLIYFNETFEQSMQMVMDTLGLPPISQSENISRVVQAYDFDLANIEEDIRLYEQAFARWGLAPKIYEPRCISTHLTTFLQKPVDIATLRSFFYQVTCDEYKNWGILSEVKDARRMLIREFQEELLFYESTEVG